MSRKWERMVEKNTKQVNKFRQKTGQARIEDKDVVIRGRSWLFPLILIFIAVFFAFTMPPEGRTDTMYTITIILYILLALFYFFARRPFLKISKNQLTWRTFTSDKIIPADQVAMIHLGDNESVIHLKNGKTKRSFSRTMNLYPMEQLNRLLRDFANDHRIPVIGDAKETKQS